MGYTTDFNGRFEFNKKLDKKTHKFLTDLAATRRMKRNVDAKYGVDGEFYVEDTADFGQSENKNIVDYNTPPSTQPSLWLQWIPSKDGKYLQWDGNAKFYNYIEWLNYLIEKVLKPRGYELNGEVFWQGEDSHDLGKITVKNNKVVVKEATITY